MKISSSSYIIRCNRHNSNSSNKIGHNNINNINVSEPSVSLFIFFLIHSLSASCVNSVINEEN